MRMKRRGLCGDGGPLNDPAALGISCGGDIPIPDRTELRPVHWGHSVVTPGPAGSPGPAWAAPSHVIRRAGRGLTEPLGGRLPFWARPSGPSGVTERGSLKERGPGARASAASQPCRHRPSQRPSLGLQREQGGTTGPQAGGVQVGPSRAGAREPAGAGQRRQSRSAGPPGRFSRGEASAVAVWTSAVPRPT